MANLTTRSLTASTVSTANLNKGSALTISEMDSNFLNLNTAKLENTTDTFTGDLTISGTVSSAVGSVILNEAADNGTNSITIKAPASFSSNLTLVLPADAGGAGYGLITDGAGNLSWSESSGDITEVIAGDGLTGGAASGSATLNVVGGTGIIANANDIELDTANVAISDFAGITANVNVTNGKYLFNTHGNIGVGFFADKLQISTTEVAGDITLAGAYDIGTSGTRVDNLYVNNLDASGTITGVSTDDVSEGTNLYYTTARANTDFDTRLATKTTDDLTEGSTNLYYTDTRADNRISLASINDLADVDTTGVANGKILKYNSTTSKFEIADDADTEDNLANNDTDDLAEGSTNLYYTDARFDTRFGTKTTDNLTEGSTNLYYTDARAQAVSINNVVEDTTPQLGGDLDVNGNKITTASSGNLVLQPNGTGELQLTNGTTSGDINIDISNGQDTDWYDDYTNQLNIKGGRYAAGLRVFDASVGNGEVAGFGLDGFHFDKHFGTPQKAGGQFSVNLFGEGLPKESYGAFTETSALGIHQKFEIKDNSDYYFTTVDVVNGDATVTDASSEAITGTSMTSGNNTVSGSAGDFSNAKIGWNITVAGAGVSGADLVTTISFISSDGSSVDTADNASTTVSSATSTISSNAFEQAAAGDWIRIEGAVSDSAGNRMSGNLNCEISSVAGDNSSVELDLTSGDLSNIITGTDLTAVLIKNSSTAINMSAGSRAATHTFTHQSQQWGTNVASNDRVNLKFQAKTVEFSPGNSGAEVNALKAYDTITYVNEDNADMDFTVNGANQDDLIRVDAGNDTVSIKNASLTSTANGNIVVAPNGTGELRVDAGTEMYNTGALLIHNGSQGDYLDLTGAGATLGPVYGAGIGIEGIGSSATLSMFGHKLNNGYPNIWSARSRDDGAGNKDFLNNNDVIFSFFGAGWDQVSGGDGTFAQTAIVELRASEDHSNTAGGGKVVIGTTNRGTTPAYNAATDKLTIADNVELNTDLDVNTQKIISTSNGDIELEPNGTGKIILDGGQNFDTTNNSYRPNGGVKTTNGLTVADTGNGYLDILHTRRNGTTSGNYSIEVANDYENTAFSSGGVAGAFGMAAYSSNSGSLGYVYPAFIGGIIGDGGSLASGGGGPTNNGVEIRTFDTGGHVASYADTTQAAEFRATNIKLMDNKLAFEYASNKSTIEAPTSGDDIEIKTTGTGYIILSNLPTSSAGLPTGAIWNDSGTLKIA